MRPMLRFASLLVRNGSLSGRSIDYEQRRIRNLREIPPDIFKIESHGRKTAYDKLRSRLLEVPVIRSLIGNLAFLKGPDKAYRQFFIAQHHGLVYIRMFKCGSTSVLKTLLPLIHPPLRNYTFNSGQIDSLAHYFVSRSIPVSADDFTFFAITRNPLERLVSAYLDLFGDPANTPDYLFGVFRKGQTFKEVVKILASIPDKYRGPHFVSQSRILNQVQNKKIATFKLIADNRELTSFLRQYSMRMSVENKSPVAYDYLEYYDPETLRLVYQIYEQDFNTLDYRSEFNEIKRIIDSESGDINAADRPGATGSN